MSFTLQNRLENKHPDPDTMKLGWRQTVRLNFHLYPPLGGGISGGWQDLADYIGKSAGEVVVSELGQSSLIKTLDTSLPCVFTKPKMTKEKNS